MPTFVHQAPDNHFSKWQPVTLHRIGKKESDLEAAILAHPGPLLLAPVGLLNQSARAYNQRRLKTGAGHTSIPDVIVLTNQGEVLVVEAKRLANAELHGRDVLAQALDYAATLSSTPEATLVSALSGGDCITWEALCARDFPDSIHPRLLAERFRDRIRNAELHIVIACDQAPDQLAAWVRAAGNQSALGFQIHVVEVCPHVSIDDEDAGIAWMPTLRVTTEIVHRTSVTVTTDENGHVTVNVQSDSATQVEEALRSPTAARLDRAQAVIAPLAQRLNIFPSALWAELHSIHQTALGKDWKLAERGLARVDDTGPNLRGNAKDGFLEGRFGVNLLSSWRPSIFVGAYLHAHDHKQALLAPNTGGDFALILDVARNKNFDGDAFAQQPAFTRLRQRLAQHAPGWDFADNLAQKRNNPWHPLHLRKPLAEVFANTKTPEARQARWLEAAESALELLLAGGELAELRRGFPGCN